MPALDCPGLMRPGQSGPMMRVPISLLAGVVALLLHPPGRPRARRVAANPQPISRDVVEGVPVSAVLLAQ
jgi:hypothetical protein